jgi:hypothetical protein
MVETKVLWQVAKAAPHRARVFDDVHAIERDTAAGGFKQATQDVHERALTRTVGAEQSEQTLRDVERHALEGSNGAWVDLDEVSDLQHGFP